MGRGLPADTLGLGDDNRRMAQKEPKPAQQVSYSLNEQDYSRYEGFVRRRALFGIPPGSVIVGMIVVLLVVAFLTDFRGFSLPVALLVGAYLVWSRLVRRSPFSDMEHLHGEHTLRLQAEGLLWRAPQGEGFVRWEAVKEVTTDGGNVYFFLGRRAAMIVPKRCFGSEGELEGFLNAASALRETPV